MGIETIMSLSQAQTFSPFEEPQWGLKQDYAICKAAVQEYSKNPNGDWNPNGNVNEENFDLFEEPQWGLKLKSRLPEAQKIEQFEEPQWGLKLKF